MVVLAPAVDLILAGPPLALFDAPTLPAPLPAPEEPAPGDPAVPLPAPVPAKLGRRWDMHVADPITHAPLTTFRTAQLGVLPFPIGLETGSTTIPVARTDPAWRQIGGVARTIRGETHYHTDPTGFEVFIGMNGRQFWSGVIVDADDDGDMVQLRVDTPPTVLTGRTLGDGGVIDQLGGRGSFPTTNLAGWVIDGLQWRWSTDAFTGARSLEVKGAGFVKAPWVTYPAGSESMVGVHTQVMVEAAGPSSVVAISTEIQTPGGAPVMEKYSADNASSTDSDVPAWQQIDSRGLLPTGAGTYRARSVMQALTDGWVRLDLLTYTQRFATGSRGQQDLTWYIDRYMGRAQVGSAGGPLGISRNVRGLVGVSDQILLLHETDPGLLESIQALTDRVDGPEVWVDTSWAMQIGARQGTDRTDIMLTDAVVLGWSMSVNDAVRFQSLRVSTGYGAGASRVALGFDVPYDGSRRTKRTAVRAPNELSYRQAEKWGAGHAEYLAQPQTTYEVTVSMDLGLRIGTGDGLRVALSNGGGFVDEALRVADRRFNVADETCVLSLGADPKVRL